MNHEPRNLRRLFRLVSVPMAFCCLVGCGANFTEDAGHCNWTLSNAETNSGTCTASGAFNSQTNQGSIAVAGVATTSSAYLDGLGIIFNGQIATGTFTTGSSVNRTAVTVALGTASVWNEAYQDPGSPDQGTCTVTVTSVSGGINGSTGTTAISVHGTATAQTPPSPAAGNTATGTVSVSITF